MGVAGREADFREWDAVTARGFHRGHEIEFDESSCDWLYADGSRVEGARVAADPNRACGRCGRDSTSEGHDKCIEGLPGVLNACCGHGTQNEAYVQLEGGVRFSGAAAAAFFEGVRDANS